ncbi:uncharacterized protein ACIB01_007376 [Guaruba guarouba]
MQENERENLNFLFPAFLQDCPLSAGTEEYEPADLWYAGVLAKPGICETQNEYQKDAGRESETRTWAVEMYKEKPGRRVWKIIIPGLTRRFTLMYFHHFIGVENLQSWNLTGLQDTRMHSKHLNYQNTFDNLVFEV